MAGIVQVSEGLKKELLQAGTGARTAVGNTITVNCTGSANGSPPVKFWSTSDPGQKPFTFQVGMGNVIKGWDEGCLTMCQGEKARLYIAGFKGYGSICEVSDSVFSCLRVPFWRPNRLVNVMSTP